jgi:hypothetical protein
MSIQTKNLDISGLLSKNEDKHCKQETSQVLVPLQKSEECPTELSRRNTAADRDGVVFFVRNGKRPGTQLSGKKIYPPKCSVIQLEYRAVL